MQDHDRSPGQSLTTLPTSLTAPFSIRRARQAPEAARPQAGAGGELSGSAARPVARATQSRMGSCRKGRSPASFQSAGPTCFGHPRASGRSDDLPDIRLALAQDSAHLSPTQNEETGSTGSRTSADTDRNAGGPKHALSPQVRCRAQKGAADGPGQDPASTEDDGIRRFTW